jgi:hypothetical protein
MKKQFNALRPFEKRMVVIIGVVLFAAVNLLVVMPHFSDMRKVKNGMDDAAFKLTRFRDFTNKIPFYNDEIRKLASDGASGEVPPEERNSEFQTAINTEAARARVDILSLGRTTVRTNNPYFVELSCTISVQSGEQQLVDFLYNLGTGPSLIRVRGLNLHPDPPRFLLAGNATLVASYQKSPPKAPARSGAAPGGKK